MPKFAAFLLSQLILVSTAFASVEVYFFEFRDAKGKIYSFDPNGKYYHAAIKLPDGRILEAHPYFGGRVAKNIKDIHYTLVAALKFKKDIPGLLTRAEDQIGRPFDLYSNWEDPKTTQCSKLVGQIIGVNPVLYDDGRYTLSPDTLYFQLKKQGFKDCQSCLNSL